MVVTSFLLWSFSAEKLVGFVPCRWHSWRGRDRSKLSELRVLRDTAQPAFYRQCPKQRNNGNIAALLGIVNAGFERGAIDDTQLFDEKLLVARGAVPFIF